MLQPLDLSCRPHSQGWQQLSDNHAWAKYEAKLPVVYVFCKSSVVPARCAAEDAPLDLSVKSPEVTSSGWSHHAPACPSDPTDAPHNPLSQYWSQPYRSQYRRLSLPERESSSGREDSPDMGEQWECPGGLPLLSQVSASSMHLNLIPRAGYGKPTQMWTDKYSSQDIQASLATQACCKSNRAGSTRKESKTSRKGMYL